MRGTTLLALLLVLVVSATGSARTWNIDPFGTGDAPTIQAGIDSASAGDTVLVGCGTYYETDITLKSGIVLTSETGNPDCVTIDGQGTGDVLHCYQVDSTCIVGLRATNGVTGIHCQESEIEVTRCVFDYNYHAGAGGGRFHLGLLASVSGVHFP